MTGAVVLAAVMLADLVTFALAVPRVGINNEWNPVLRDAYMSDGLFPLVLIKVIAFAVIVAALYRFNGAQYYFALTVAITIAALGVISNLTSLWSVG